MAPTIKWQRFEQAVYDWFDTSATGPIPQIESELDAWIASVNANPSNTGRQVNKIKGYADGSGNYLGWVLQVGANNNTDNGYFGMWSASTTALRGYIGRTYTDNASNGGYGTITTNPYGAQDSSIGYASSGQDADFLLIYDSTDGKEFFCLGKAMGTATGNMDGFLIYKTTSGEWALGFNDSSTWYGISYFDDVVGTGWVHPKRTATQDSCGYRTMQSYMETRWCLMAVNGTIIDPLINHYAMPAASDYLFAGANGNTGTRYYWSHVGNGDEIYMLQAFYYGPRVLVDLRP